MHRRGALVVAACALAPRAEAAPSPAAAPSAEGPVLAVTRPASFALDFGTIARDQAGSAEITIHNPGNAPLEITLGAPGGPFTAPATASLGPGETRTLAIACRSATALPAASKDVTLTSNAVQSNTAAISVRCAVADTQLEVMPGALAFGEVRVGATPPMIAVALRNPGPNPMLIAQVALAGAHPSLHLLPELTKNRMLAPGESIALVLSLAPTAELDLGGARLEIDVDGARLELPISGLVVTPAARVSPVALDLGTACVGTQVTGTVRLINTGTATLTMQRPEMDRAFVALLQLPESYPAPLPPGYDATVGVSPRTSQVGAIDGTLTWDVDAPAGPFAVPVMLHYIDAGAAISPKSLIFGSIDTGQASPRQTVTLENCNPAPIRLAIEGVVATEGALDAWEVTPATDERTLGPRDRLQLTAQFRPKHAGPHAAQIQLSIDDQPGAIELTGDALGEVPGPTSFYACSCRAPGSPARGAPLALAVLLALRRRRDRRARSCSTR